MERISDDVQRRQFFVGHFDASRIRVGVVDAIAPVPVIAAGGIADGRGVVAALALGAEAVWVGTRLVASQEAYAHDEYKRRIVEAEPSDTVRTTIFGPESHGMRNELYFSSRTGVRASFIALTFARCQREPFLTPKRDNR